MCCLKCKAEQIYGVIYCAISYYMLYVFRIFLHSSTEKRLGIYERPIVVNALKLDF